MEILIPERTDMTPLLGMDRMKKFRITIGRIQLAENNQSEREKVINNLPDLLESRETIRYRDQHPTETGTLSIKQKTRPVPLHLQEDVGRELEKLIKSGNLEKINDVDEDCFLTPMVITVTSDKSLKIALDARKLNGLKKRIDSVAYHIQESSGARKK